MVILVGLWVRLLLVELAGVKFSYLNHLSTPDQVGVGTGSDINMTQEFLVHYKILLSADYTNQAPITDGQIVSRDVTFWAMFSSVWQLLIAFRTSQLCLKVLVPPQ